MSTLSSVTAAPTGGAGIVTAGGAEGAPPVTIAAFQNADVLIVAVGDRCGTGAGPAATPPRPARTQDGAGWYVVPPRIATSTKSTAAPAKTTAPKTSSSTTATSSKSSGTSTSKSTSSTTPKSTGPLAFLDDPKMSIEEKLFKFVSYISDNYEKQLLDKIHQLKAKESGKSDGLSGVLSSVGIGDSAGIGKLLGQVAGPVMAAGATALGFPEFAPVLMKAGPSVANGVMGLLGGSGKSSTSSSSSSSSSTKTNEEKEVSQSDMAEIQWLQEKQKQAFSLISNLLKSMSDMKMGIINNLRD
jgi:hypothetical protein